MFDPASLQYAFQWLITWAFAALFCYALLLYVRTLWAYVCLAPVIPRTWPFVALLSAIAAIKACPVDVPPVYLKGAVYAELVPLALVIFARGKCSPRVRRSKPDRKS